MTAISWTLIFSVLLRLTALIWAVVLARRLRDWRVGFVTVPIAATLGHQVKTLVSAGGHLEPRSAPYGILVGILTLLAIYFLQRVFAERDQAREAMRQSEAKLATVFRSSPDSIMILSLDDGSFADVNEAFEKTSGYRRDEVVGKTPEQVEVWADPEQRQTLLDELRTRKTLRNVEVDFRTRSGSLRSTLISGAVIEIDGKRHLLAQTRDVTEHKRAAETREQLLDELKAKNDELERFTYTVSHDLKSPLVTLHGFLGLLKKDLADGRAERVARDMDRIQSAANTMQHLLRDLLELSRIGRMFDPPEKIPLTPAAHEAAERVAGRLAERGIEVEIAPDMPAIFGDRPRILQALQNLIDNAAKFIGDGDQPKIEIGAREDGDEVVCFVRDNGIGIDPRFHEKIFGLFDRLDKAYAGTGIGLALVARIMTVHDGRVWVESEGEGHGSTFYFALPRPAAAGGLEHRQATESPLAPRSE